MSPTPILDRQQPPPAAPPVKRAPSLAIGAVIGVIILLLPGGWLSGNDRDPLLVLAGFVPAFFLFVLLHELGHAVAGLLVGFEFRRILVGPWMFTKESSGYRFRFMRGRFLAGGYTLMAPREPEDLRQRFAGFAAGGAAMTLLLFLPIALLPWGPLTASLLLVNLYLAFFSWVPLEMRGHYTDGKIIQVLMRQGPAADRLSAVLYLMTLDGRGVAPKDWPAHVRADLAAEGGGATYRSTGRIFLYIYARETAPPAEVAATLEEVLRLAGELRPDLRRSYFAEAAFWQGVTNRNAALATAWLDDARGVKNVGAQKDWDACAMAAITFANGNRQQFQEHLGRALAYLDRLPGPSGSVAASRERLLGLSVVAQ